MQGVITVENRPAIGQESVVQPGDMIPLGNLDAPSDVSNTARSLTGDEVAYATDHCLVVDGGLTAQLRPPIVNTSPLSTTADRNLTSCEDVSRLLRHGPGGEWRLILDQPHKLLQLGHVQVGYCPIGHA